MSFLFTVSSKCKSFVQNGERFENLSWRIWAQQNQRTKVPPAESVISSVTPYMQKCYPMLTPSASAPLSEPELSTDESVTSEEGDADDHQRADRTSCLNEFSILTRHHTDSTVPTPQFFQKLADDVEQCWLHSSYSSIGCNPTRWKRGSDDIHEEEDETVQGSESRSTGTPISTTGTVTPNVIRSRANSTTQSPRTQALGPKVTEALVPPKSQDLLAHNCVTALRPDAMKSAMLFEEGAAATNSALPVSSFPNPQMLSVPAATCSVSSSPLVSDVSVSVSTSKSTSPRPPGAASTVALAGARNAGIQAPPAPSVASGIPSRMRRQQRIQKSTENLPALRATKSYLARMNAANVAPGHVFDGKPKQEKAKKKQSKILFTVGGDSEEDELPTEGDNEDDWSSEDDEANGGDAGNDTSTHESARLETERAQRELDEECERIEMFKKRPIRSASLADLPHASNAMPPPTELGPTRGLLSTMLKPSEVSKQYPHRPRAGQTVHLSHMPNQAHCTRTHASARNPSTPTHLPRAPSFQTIRCNPTSGADKKDIINRSKSALALPLLNLTSLRSSTSSGRIVSPSPKHAVGATSPEPGRAVSNHGSESDESSAPPRTRSNLALSRLSAIAQRETSSTITTPTTLSSDTGDGRRLSSLVRSCNSIGNLMTATKPDSAHTAVHSIPSPASQHAPAEGEEDGLCLGVEADERAPLRVQRVLEATPQTTDVPQFSQACLMSDTMTESPVPQHATECSGTMPPLVDTVCEKEQSQPPEALVPTPCVHTDALSDPLHRRISTPNPLSARATVARQNILDEELSQSVRENLQWERKSRARLLGIGLMGTVSSQRPRRTTDSRVVGLDQSRPHTDEGSFHHKGW